MTIFRDYLADATRNRRPLLLADGVGQVVTIDWFGCHVIASTQTYTPGPPLASCASIFFSQI